MTVGGLKRAIAKFEDNLPVEVCVLTASGEVVAEMVRAVAGITVGCHDCLTLFAKDIQMEDVHLKTAADDADPHYVSQNVRWDGDQPDVSVGEGKWGNPATWDWYRVADVASKMSFNLPDGPHHNTMFTDCTFDHNVTADEPVVIG